MNNSQESASIPHIQLADFLKSVHKKLREDAKSLGADVTWTKHCENKELLSEYAEVMKTLATKCWDKNFSNSKMLSSRITWVGSTCIEYFNADILIKRKREIELCKKLNLDICKCDTLENISKIKLLDVGSCYNPFKIFEEFEVFPVDIAPANEEVFFCDFLNVPISNSLNISCNTVSRLPNNYFHIVVFSLVLEYLPSPDQRLSICEKALHVLQPEGLLCIITPDSNHMNANINFIKTWRYLLARIGFSLVKYQKLKHLHCLALRKSITPALPQRWANLHLNYNYYNAMVIPQDFNENQNSDANNGSDVGSAEGGFVELFDELPRVVTE